MQRDHIDGTKPRLTKQAYRSSACFAASAVRHMAILIHARSERQSERTLSEQTAAIFSSEILLACISSRSRPGDFDPVVGEGSAMCPTISPALQDTR